MEISTERAGGKQSVNLFEMDYSPEDLTAIREVLERRTWWAQGPECEQFEETLASYVGSKYCVLFNSGTSALHAAMLAHGIGEGDEVIVPSFTFIATANCVKFVGATPVFTDIEDQTYGLDPIDVERKITPRTRAIIPVHFAGFPCQIGKLRKLAGDHKLILVEDASEALGAEFASKIVGTFGNSGVLSFCQGKLVCTGEGGAVVTNDEEICESLRKIQNHGKLGIHSDFFSLGYNFRMSSITAALGLSHLRRISTLIDRRRWVASKYFGGLGQISGLKLPISLRGSESVYQMYPVRILDGRRDALKTFLWGKGIDTGVYFKPIHKSTYYEQLGYHEQLLVTESVSGEILSLPMYPGIPTRSVDYVIESIKEFLR